MATIFLGTTALTGQVFPDMVSDTVAPGDFIIVDKKICTPEVLPSLEIYFLADTTGSMSSVIAAVKANAAALVAAFPNAKIGAGNYKDFPFDAYAYQHQANVDANPAGAVAAIGAWSATGGADGSEAQLYALDQIAKGAAGFTLGDDTVTRVVVWFGDAPGHDPVCSGISGLGYDITEASVTADLMAAGIRIIAISTTTGYPAGLDDDPTLSAGNYAASCAIINGSPGQATDIVDATGGVHLANVAAADIVDAILAGISALPATVEAVPLRGCDRNLTITADPVTVTSGDCASVTEIIRVHPRAPQCDAVLTCSVAWTINGAFVLLDNGELDPAYVQEIAITVPDVRAPRVWCVPSFNPSGKHIPNAGKNPKSGQNPDGFYRFLARDNCDEDPEIFVVDNASGVVFGPFSSGVNVKITQAPGKTPSIKPMAGAVDYHLHLQGDAVLIAYDDAGHASVRSSCLVPPPPK